MHALHENSVVEPMSDGVLIVCIGNDLVGDDAVGCAVHAALQQESFPKNVKLIMLGIGGMSLFEYLDGTYGSLIVVDAVCYGNAPGTVTAHSLDSLPVMMNSPVSLHGIGVREVIAAGRILYPDLMPNTITVVGIEGVNFHDCGVPLTLEVENAIGEAVDVVRAAVIHDKRKIP